MPFTILHRYMQNALELAHKAAQVGEVPVGAIIVDSASNTSIAMAHNLVETNHDPTAHAELLAIRQACQTLKTTNLSNCTLFVTLEPCAMCAQAIAWAKVGKVVFGASDPKSGGVDHGSRVFKQPTCHHKPEIINGILEEQCAQPLKAFFHDKRK